MDKRKKRKIGLILGNVFLIAVVALWVIIYVKPVVEEALTQTEVVEYGTMQVIDEVDCWFVRDEEVVYAAEGGSIQYYFNEGDLLRKGSRILEIIGSSTPYTAPESGYTVSYYVDGYEGSFTPETMRELSRSRTEALDVKVENCSRSGALAGEAIYKLVKNDYWYAVFWVPAEDITKYTKGGSVGLELSLGEVRGSTYDIVDAGGEWMVILRFNRYYEDSAKLRRVSARVVTSDYDGLIVRNISITNEGDQAGVYVKGISGDFVFTPVKIKTSDGEYSLIEASYYYEQTEEGSVKVNTVEVYDEILTDAQS